MTYADAMERYGCDRPDLRYGLELRDVTAIFADSRSSRSHVNAIVAGGRVRGIVVPGGASLSRKQVDEIEAIAKSGGAGGLMRIKCVNGVVDGAPAKALSDAGRAALGLVEGDLMLLVAAPDHVSNPSLDRARQDVARRLSLVPEERQRAGLGDRFPHVRRRSCHRQARRHASSIHGAEPSRSWSCSRRRREMCARWRTTWFSTVRSWAAEVFA